MGRLMKTSVFFALFFSFYSLLAKVDEKPSMLIPLPQQVSWGKGQISIGNIKSIVISDDRLQKEALILQQMMKQMGAELELVDQREGTAGHRPVISLALAQVEAPHHEGEAYHLQVAPAGITLKANTEKGIFYAIQTLMQLARPSGILSACDINDWPAYAWRGYMVDVGRNFQSMALLKEQIDVMAAYKLNIFHFHLTEDIAWRLESKKFPQLTESGNMLRNAGKYYTEADFKELIAYCKARHITLVPEIDMPGHSGAFERAMKTDMQSDSGMFYLKQLLQEFCDTYDLDYLHVGGDEVKITNEQFLPEMVAFLDSMGKRTLGWEPGGNLPGSTIRQLWQEGPSPVSDTALLQYVDSKHLYLNHMDPLETVTTLFHRQIGGQPMGNNALLGGILCSWPDRAVRCERDVLNQNAIYPGMITFAERAWQGGGVAEWVANIGAPGTWESSCFAAFEKRLLDHQQHYFVNKPFPYMRQANIKWQFYGPYANGGDLEQSFEPSNRVMDSVKYTPAFETLGGTVILRHWWDKVIQGILTNPEEFTTWYAQTRIWSESDTIRDFWIGFDNFSRSYASDAPLAGTWDNRKSRVWVNGGEIRPPNWKQAGRKGDLERPMMDEGYTFREPSRIKLKRGWNNVLVKLPVGSFKGKDWQNPVKWMFTFVPVD
ncbi:beta-N-acetylhexosaminidase [Olivibacter sp. SDN3]|uniref:family 20 glycosylhydrolase n=1 Tax=Olivibacter sp. SDN3 TaxID=2764720 RepID=UPI0016518973|nr:family 20 glycosylhydrolase [Olivibacter sp. SDN3]QNL52023.1 beta-N-acetylhexosaminidase [Olivibacter sp. SDN3]